MEAVVRKSKRMVFRCQETGKEIVGQRVSYETDSGLRYIFVPWDNEICSGSKVIRDKYGCRISWSA